MRKPPNDAATTAVLYMQSKFPGKCFRKLGGIA
jgi:hypothetical protein